MKREPVNPTAPVAREPWLRERRPGTPALEREVMGRITRVGIAIVVSLIAGVALVRFQPLLIIGAVVCGVAAYIVATRPFIGLLLYTCTFMLRPGELFPALRPLHVERLIGALSLVGMYLAQQQNLRKLVIDGTRQTRLLLLLAISVLISVPFAFWRSAALEGFIDFLKLVAWYLLIVHLVNTRTRLRVFIVLFLVLVGYVGFDALRGYIVGSTKYAQGIVRAIGQTDAGGDPNHLAATMAATIPILLLLGFSRRLRWYRIFPAAGAMMLAVTMSLTGSRSGLLGFLGGLVFLWVGIRRRLVTAIIGIVILGVGLTVMPDQYKARYSTITRKELDGSSQGRIVAWKKGVRMMADRPLTGVGLDCFGTANALKYSPKDDPSWLESHSLYVQVPAEIGILGAVFFFAFLYEILRVNARVRRRLELDGGSWELEATTLRGLAAGVVVLLITGVFGHSFLRHTWYVYGALGVVITRLYADRSIWAPDGKRVS
jgi:probable O-glycosylation ligase (exosortase A-associated)